MRGLMSFGRLGRAGRLAAVLLSGPGCVTVQAEAATPGTIAIEAACQPAALGAAALGALGLALAERDLDDRGFAVERWRTPAGEGEPEGWALVILLRDAAGALQDDVQHKVNDKKQTMTTAAIAGGVLILLIVFFLGKRSGKKKTTYVELRRI